MIKGPAPQWYEAKCPSTRFPPIWRVAHLQPDGDRSCFGSEAVVACYALKGSATDELQIPSPLRRALLPHPAHAGVCRPPMGVLGAGPLRACPSVRPDASLWGGRTGRLPAACHFAAVRYPLSAIRCTLSQRLVRKRLVLPMQ